MSDNVTKFWLELDLKNDFRKMILDVNAEIATKDFDVLVKIIEKASQRDIELNPIAKVLKDDLLNKLCQDGWKIENAKFIVKDHELLEYFKERRAKGGTAYTAHDDKWPWVRIVDINIFNLLFDGHLSPTNYVDGCSQGGYVHTSHYKMNQEASNKSKENGKSSWKNFSSDKKPATTTVTTSKFNMVQLNKTEGKICRKEIIDIASTTDVCTAGFKPEFMESLSDKHRSYLHGCSDLQVKLMKSDVIKK